MNGAWRGAAAPAWHLFSWILTTSNYLTIPRDIRKGTTVSRQVALFLKNNLRRSTDVAGRFGGEEFALILPVTTLEGAERLSEELRQGIESLACPHPACPSGILTASFGVSAVIPMEETSVDQLIEAADRALYRAKVEGRNRVCTADK
ncbi:MAG TPA: GGDEF domain-containing protein [Thermoanaerobaculia bacterium]|nr:GGDEF domain-containing protein [Thermoanaerobaculia bacterium]HUM30204.1 GGDEF domain-containing protein [Thermoanaerobaculia bacterium]HXK68347.1 GGDEF domain-containing protein [Thermoanaerobaculia bacterium]